MTNPADVHVLPVNDLREHDETRTCWCRPRIEIEEDFLTALVGQSPGSFERRVLVVHHSLDGRELVEQHGVN